MAQAVFFMNATLPMCFTSPGRSASAAFSVASRTSVELSTEGEGLVVGVGEGVGGRGDLVFVGDGLGSTLGDGLSVTEGDGDDSGVPESRFIITRAMTTTRAPRTIAPAMIHGP